MASGFKRISKMLDLWRAPLVRPKNRNDVKPGGLFEATVLLEPRQRNTGDLLLLAEIDRFKRLTIFG